MSFQKARVIGVGSYLPERVLTNHDLEKMVDTSDEWIFTRTGMKERRIAHSEEFTSDMGAKAAKSALAHAGMQPSDIQLIICATMSPDYISPSTASLIQHKLGAPQAAAMDVQAACTGYLYALSTAKAFIESGMYKNILVIAAEKMSAFLDYQDRNTCILFGDGAAAAIVTDQGAGLAIDTICLGADGELAELIIVPAGGARKPANLETVDKKLHFIQLMGKEVFKHAVRRMGAATRECLDRAGLKDEDISWLVPHQANERIMDAIAKNFNIPMDKVFKTVHKYGNTSASSVAIALDELIREKKVHDGEHILLVAFGAGLTWGASVLTKVL